MKVVSLGHTQQSLTHTLKLLGNRVGPREQGLVMCQTEGLCGHTCGSIASAARVGKGPLVSSVLVARSAPAGCVAGDECVKGVHGSVWDEPVQGCR